MAVLCVAAEHSGLIEKKKGKESLWVKVKSFPTGGLIKYEE